MLSRLPKRGGALIRIDEIQTIIYGLVLLLTLVYGITAMNNHYDLKEKRERAKYRTGTPPLMVEGVVLVIADNDDADTLAVNWRVWMHKVRINVTKTEFLFVVPPNISWAAIGPSFVYSKCQIYDTNGVCMMEEGLRSIGTIFPNFKWVLKVRASTFVNYIGLSQYLSSLRPTFYRTQFIAGAIKQTRRDIHYDQRAGLFLSRASIRDWLDSMIVFTTAADKLGGSVELATATLPDILGIDIKKSADPRFVPHSKTMDEYNELIDIGANECPPSFRYFNLSQMNITQIRKCVTWDLQLNAEERRVAMMQIPRSPASYGYTTDLEKTELCSIPRVKPKSTNSKKM